VAAGVGGERAGLLPDLRKGILEAAGAAEYGIRLRLEPRVVLDDYWEVWLFFHVWD
jgi:hypothetical protein